MKKIKSTILVLLIINYFLNAQVAFVRTYNQIYTSANSVVQTADSGFIITGAADMRPYGNYDVFLLKTNTKGESIWSKTFDFEQVDGGYAVQQTKDGGYVICGCTQKAYPSNSQIIIIKTDNLGDTLWTKSYGEDLGYFSPTIQETNDGGYILTGSSFITLDTTNIYLLKVDSIGEKLWLKNFKNTNYLYSGVVQQPIDNGFIIIGSIERAIYLDSDSAKKVHHISIIKTNDIGNIIWTCEYGDDVSVFGYDIKQTSENAFVITGSTTSANKTSEDFLLIKFDSKGNLLWSNTYGGEGFDEARAISLTSEGGYLLTGNSNSTDSGKPKILMIKTDSLGKEIWQKFYGENENTNFMYSAYQTFDGGNVIAGSTFTDVSNSKAFVVKTNSDGCLIPLPIIVGETVLCTGTKNDLEAGSIYNGNKYLWSDNETTEKITISHGGKYSVKVTDNAGCILFDSIDVKEISLPYFYLGNDTILNSYESLVLKADSNCTSYLWSNGSSIDSMLVNSSNFGTGEKKISLLVYDQYGCSFSDTILITINSNNNIISNDFKTVLIYPNPSIDIINIKIVGENTVSELSILNENGTLLLKKNIESDFIPIDISNYPKGLYFVNIKSVKFSKSIKIVKY